MASMLIHMCIAKEINKEIKIKNEKEYMLGATAPDIGKHIDNDRELTHFIFDGENIDIEYFLSKYKYELDRPFMIGYYVHLYTDILWEKYFMNNIVDKNSIKLLDGTNIVNTEENYKKLIYNDYTNLNSQLIKMYNIDNNFYFNDWQVPNCVLDEIPLDKLNIIIEYNNQIIKNTKLNKSYTFDIENIIPFINICKELIISEIKRLNSIFKVYS